MVSGPCETNWLSDGVQFNYPLPHGDGNVSVNMKMVSGVPALVSVCAEQGWTAEGKSEAGGVQLKLSYAGQPAIDFKYILGKTDIRYR